MSRSKVHRIFRLNSFMYVYTLIDMVRRHLQVLFVWRPFLNTVSQRCLKNAFSLCYEVFAENLAIKQSNKLNKKPLRPLPVAGLGSVLLTATNGMTAWQCQDDLALSYSEVTVHVTAARACPCFKMAWPGLLKAPHLLPHKELEHPSLHLHKACRSGSTLKKKISALSWNHISDAPERRQVFM